MGLRGYGGAAAVRRGEWQGRGGALEEAKDSGTISVQTAPDGARAAEEVAAVLRALGKNADGANLARERLARLPLSDFLREELGKPNVVHLAADSYRVLNVASEYARFGL